MPLSNKKRVILAKIEPIYGVAIDSTMVASDAVLCQNLTISPMEGSVVERSLVRPYFGSSGTARAETFATISFDTELVSGIAPNSTPQWDNLIKSSSFSSTIMPAIPTTTAGTGSTTGVVTLAAAANSATVQLASSMSSADGAYVGMTLRVGTGVAAQAVKIITYNGSTKTATVSPVITASQTITTAYELIITGVVIGVVSALQVAGATSVTLDSNASPADGAYIGYGLRVGGQVCGLITAYAGATKVATVAIAVTAAQTAGVTAYELQTPYAHTVSLIRLLHNSSAIDNIYAGTTITVTTGGATPEVREIVSYNGASRTAALGIPLTTVPTAASTFSISAATIYTPSSDVASTGNSSATFVVNIDGQNHVIYGARGSFSIDMTVKQFPMMKWTFTGMVGVFSASPQIIGDFTAWELPSIVNTVNTTNFNLCGFSPAISKFSFDIGNTVTHRLLIGSEAVVTSDRKPKGSITIEASTAMLNNYLTLIKSDTAGAFYIRHGTAAGDWVSISGPQVQLGAPKYAEQDALVMLDMSLDFQPLLSVTSATGNNEIRIVCK